MTKKKNFHGPGGKGGLVRQMAFFYRTNPATVRFKPRVPNRQALGDLQKNGLPGAANTEQAEGGTDLTGPDSTYTITENAEFVNRRAEGLASSRQIRFLESRGFRHVERWSFEDAKAMIDRIADNGWRVPPEIIPQEYEPERAEVAV